MNRARLWPAEALVNLYAATLAALGALAAGWWGASGANRISHQLAWLNLAAAGLVVAGTANVAWLLRGRRAVGLRARSLLVALDPGVGPAGVGPTNPAADAAGTTADAAGTSGPSRVPALLAVGGLGRFHQLGCPMLTGKSATTAPEDEHRAAGRVACGVCRP